MSDLLNVEYRPVATLIPRARNPRAHSAAQAADIAASIVEYTTGGIDGWDTLMRGVFA